MSYKFWANTIVVFHIVFIVFVVFGGILVWRNKKWMWAHIPSVAWAFLVEVCKWVCPLTKLENDFRKQADLEGYQDGFIEHYVLPILYPQDLMTPDDFRTIQIGLGVFVLLLNAGIYYWVLKRKPKED